MFRQHCCLKSHFNLAAPVGTGARPQLLALSLVKHVTRRVKTHGDNNLENNSIANILLGASDRYNRSDSRIQSHVNKNIPRLSLLFNNGQRKQVRNCSKRQKQYFQVAIMIYASWTAYLAFKSMAYMLCRGTTTKLPSIQPRSSHPNAIPVLKP